MCMKFFVCRKLGINMINNIVPISHIIKILVNAFIVITKKTHLKDRNVVFCVLENVILNNNSKVLLFLKPASKLVHLYVKTLYMYCIRREHIETDRTNFQAFIHRLPRFGLKLIDATLL